MWGPNFDVTDLSHARDTAERKETNLYHVRCRFDEKAENVQILFKHNVTKQVFEELWLTLTHKKSR